MDQNLFGYLGLGGYLVALLSGVIALLPKKGSLENQIIDQYQEDAGAKTGRIASLEARVEKLEGMLLWYQRRDIAWERREFTLMTWAENHEYPPWPDREGILTEVPNV